MMTEWMVAVVVASLLGSGHCVGMCGPFAILAAGGPSPSDKPWQRVLNLSSYHLGRWATYLILGAGLGAVGGLTDGLALSAGWTPIAARLVGGMMIAMGILQIVRLLRGQSPAVKHSNLWARWSQLLVRWRQGWRFETAIEKAFSWGFISTWLPCGWLYVFAIAAAGTGGVVSGMLLMTAFWVGTLPLLSLFSLGVSALGTRVQRFVQPVTACVLIAFGIFTATSRAEIDLRSLKGLRSSHEPGAASQGAELDALQEVLTQELPCCEAGGDDATTED